MEYFKLFKEYSSWLSILALIISISSCSYINKKLGLKDDHPIEQAAEKMLEQRTGLHIDFTPESP